MLLNEGACLTFNYAAQTCSAYLRPSGGSGQQEQEQTLFCSIEPPKDNRRSDRLNRLGHFLSRFRADNRALEVHCPYRDRTVLLVRSLRYGGDGSYQIKLV